MPLITQQQPPYYTISEILPPPTPGTPATQAILRISQTGTSNPTITTIKNNLGTISSFTRSTIGEYSLNFTNPILITDKTDIYTNNVEYATDGIVVAKQLSTTEISIQTKQLKTDLEGLPLTWAKSDNMLNETFITITVQP